MREVDRLLLRLRNLSKQKVKTAPFDVEWLIAAINDVYVPPKQGPVSAPAKKTVSVDGGKFVDED